MAFRKNRGRLAYDLVYRPNLLNEIDILCWR